MVHALVNVSTRGGANTDVEQSGDMTNVDANPPQSQPQPESSTIVVPREEWEAVQQRILAVDLLQSRINALEASNVGPSQRSSPPRQSSEQAELKALRDNLTAPKPFNGSDARSPTEFVRACRTYFSAGRFNNSAVQVAMVSTWLVGTAAEWFHREASNIGDSFDVFVTKFLDFFEHAQRPKQARAKLDVLRMQGKLSSFDAYAKEFTRLLAESETLKPDTYTAKLAFMRGLTRDLRQFVVGTGVEYDTWEAVRDACYKHENQSLEAALGKREAPDAADDRNPKKPRFPNANSTPKANNKPDGNGKHAGKPTGMPKLTTDQHTALVNAKLCIRCGQSGHIKKDCKKPLQDCLKLRAEALKKLGF